MSNATRQFTKQETAICIVATLEGISTAILESILKNPAYCDDAIARKQELAQKVIKVFNEMK